MDYDNFDAVLHYLWARTQGDAWFKPTEENISAGVCLRVEQGRFRVFPYENRYLIPFETAVRQLNPLVAIKIRSAAVHAALGTVAEDSTAIYLDIETRIQILDNISQLPTADKEQCGAFIRDERVLIVWSDDLDNILSLCSDFERKLMKLVWNSRKTMSGTPSLLSVSGSASVPPSTTASDVNLAEKPNSTSQVSSLPSLTETTTQEPKPKSRWNWSWRLSRGAPAKISDLEKGSTPQPRPTRLFAPFYGGFGAGLSIFFIGSGLSILMQEYRLDNDWRRFMLLVTTPFLYCVSLFFALQTMSSVTFLFGPVAHYHENSRYYSAVPPDANTELDARLPHVTVELPVYKESLQETIAPSVHSLKKAMQTYARQGGTSSIFVHDDGLQLLSSEEREQRIQFYANHNIGWVARPPHSNDPDGFKRAGRFKKASNMNYGLALSLKMEAKLAELEVLEASGVPSDENGICLEDKALQMAVEEMYEATGKKWKPWACNGRSLRVGDVILIVDSDTIVPEDCFRDAARELAESPDVAIIQHESDVMQVAHHFFENGIAHFTRRINKCISMGCANGEVAPFVGHNAFLRWSAIQDAAFVDPDDGVKKIWSESNVSEDFDMALRLQLKGYIIRWATYSDGGFKEGVSLTVDDELNRWQKYAYGCNELIFNPLISWWKMGPITKQLRTFIWSGAPVHYKISMMSYMFSYYGLAASAMLSVLNYFLLGWAADVDGYYLKSFEIWLACTVVFPGAGNVGYTLLEYRLGRRNLFSAFLENIAWVPFFFFFFGGLSIHLSAALLAHMFSYNIKWEATKKEVERSNFFIEVPRIWKRYRHIMVLGPLIVTAGHMLFPIVLNPWLMIFSY
ncbi:glycosyl transferase family group 2-domain-containing protein [Lentinula guzmanii]|uniref:Glycosyl transferase family group 2-domain-containing protein n=1 Tax=Lentinula guzmanii TaxID=2804957 RepID=A0AA38MUA2_9AGAR|nr:glycosyl transferase family group 2-domain-containing protein [Lentinula guzmanii]